MSYFPPPQLRVAAASKVEAEAKKPQTFLFHDLYDGHMPNHWGVSIPGQVGQGRKEAHYICGWDVSSPKSVVESGFNRKNP